jgi:hypothetical protein
MIGQLNQLGFGLCDDTSEAASHLDFVRLSQDSALRLRLSKATDDSWSVQVFVRRLTEEWLRVPLDQFGATTDDASLTLTTRELHRFPAVLERAVLPLADGMLGP